MRNKLYSALIVVFSAVFALHVLAVMAADRLFSVSMAAEEGGIAPERGIKLIDIATKLDPGNAELYYRKYKLLLLTGKDAKGSEKAVLLKRRLHALGHCINLCPSRAVYHIFYGLTVARMTARPNAQTRQIILSELRKASELNPSNSRYKKRYLRYLERFKPQS